MELADLVADGVYRRTAGTPTSRGRPTRAPAAGELWFFDVDGERVWGATARMLHELALVSLGIPVPGWPDGSRPTVAGAD